MTDWDKAYDAEAARIVKEFQTTGKADGLTPSDPTAATKTAEELERGDPKRGGAAEARVRGETRNRCAGLARNADRTGCAA